MTKLRHTSIGQRIKRAGNRAYRVKLSRDWAGEWQAEHDELLRRLEAAINDRDGPTALQCVRQLRGVADKRYDALGRLFDAIAEPGLPDERE